MQAKKMRGLKGMLVGGALWSAAFFSAPAKAETRALPPDAGVVNVKDYGAVGDGVADDTEALRAAVRFALNRETRYATPPFVYLPAGTYLVAGTIEGKVAPHGWSGGWRAGLILWGESREKTVIKLQDRRPDFGDPEKPRPVLITGSESDKTTKPDDPPLSGGGNRAFRHGVYNLTIDVGAGNPGAVGLDYLAHNRGSVESVTIRSSDPERVGHTGLLMTRNWPGPCLIKDVRIEGFDAGIRVAHFEYGNVFEDIALVGQRVVGLHNRQNMLAIRRLTSENAVPAIHAADANGLAVVVEATLAGGAPDQPAARGPGAFYLRDVRVEGYGKAVDAAGRKEASDLPTVSGAAQIALYTSSRYAMGAPEADALRLPIVETPRFWSDRPDDWVKPQQFLAGAEPPESDWTDALQAALDSGKPIVYLPNGSYRITRALSVPATVRLIVGFQSAVTPGKDNKDKVDPLLRFVGAGAATTVEHVWISGHVEQASSRPVAFRHCDITGRYRNTAEGSGDVFFDDTIGPKPMIIAHPQRVFGRQVNIEFGGAPLIENHGGDLWLLGYKTEGEMICIRQTSGRTELLGGLFYPLRKVSPETPAVRLESGVAALSFAMSGPRYPIPVRAAARGGEQFANAADVGGRSAPLVYVRAGPEVEPRADRLDSDVIEDEGIPYWKGKTDGETPAEFRDSKGHRWAVMALGNSNDLAHPDRWRPLRWNAAAGRWQGEQTTDQAPSYSRDRVLRGRGGEGRLVGLLFQPAEPGRYALQGRAQADTWLPDGPAEIVVLLVGSGGDVKTLLRREIADRAFIEWAEQEALRAIEMPAGARLLITFAPTKAQTGSLMLSADPRNPTRIEKAP